MVSILEEKIELCKKIMSVKTEESITTALLLMYNLGLERSNFPEEKINEDYITDEVREEFELSDVF